MRRLEQKFYAPQGLTPEKLEKVLGCAPLPVQEELDTHFRTHAGKLILRRTAGKSELVHYRRLHTPLPCECSSRKVPIFEDGLEALLRRANGVRAEVSKGRFVFEGSLGESPVTVRLDHVQELGAFVELSTPLAGERKDPEPADSVLAGMAEHLGLSAADAVPYGYGDLRAMQRAAKHYRQQLAGVEEGAGRMIILDGASCSGKTTLGSWLLDEAELGLELVPRYTTRAPRPEEKSGSEYIFISQEELHHLLDAGQLFEFRDFEFGMSYGLPWKPAVELLRSGRHGLGIMNLGNIRHVKWVFPEAVTVLIHAPVATIQRRLEERGMPDDHIEERLGNARRVEAYRDYYDHVVENDDGVLEEAKAQLRRIVRVRGV